MAVGDSSLAALMLFCVLKWFRILSGVSVWWQVLRLLFSWLCVFHGVGVLSVSTTCANSLCALASRAAMALLSSSLSFVNVDRDPAIQVLSQPW